MNEKNIYLVISRTQTKFARCIRYFGDVKYNHSAIGLDKELKELYAFSRPQHRAIFLGHLVRETLDRYTLKKECSVPVIIFKIPVTETQHQNISDYIHDIACDPEYMYNLFSVLTYPLTQGFSTYKTFNCTEFAAHVLKKLDYPLDQPAYRYKPDDFLDILKDNIVFDGDLREYMLCTDTDAQYFKFMNPKMMCKNFFAMLRIIGRTYFT